MSVETALARISEIDSALSPPAPRAAPSNGSFAQVLGQAGVAQTAQLAPAGGGATGAVAAAQGEVGQAEQPPGSNDSPRIAQYRSAVGGGVGPWCAYFASWCAQQAGTPLGERGQGFASVDAAWDWAQRSGRAVPSGSGQPRPGDLIVWDEHIGVVEAVDPDGKIHTIEGNSSDAVSRRTYGAGEGIGYIRVG